MVVKVRYPDGRTERFQFGATFSVGTPTDSHIHIDAHGHVFQHWIVIAEPDVRLDPGPSVLRWLRLNHWEVDPDFVHVLHVGDVLQVADHVLLFELVAGTPYETQRYFGEVSREPDPAEEEVLAALRADPADAQAREVYADWLDGHERCGEAELVRLQWLPDGKRITDTEAFSSEWMSHQPQAIRLRLRDLAQLSDPGRRALTSRPTVVCRRAACHRRWELFDITGVDTTRYCGSCERDVQFCSEFDQLAEAGAAGAPVALDPLLVEDAARQAYDQEGFDEPTMPIHPLVDD